MHDSMARTGVMNRCFSRTVERCLVLSFSTHCHFNRLFALPNRTGFLFIHRHAASAVGLRPFCCWLGSCAIFSGLLWTRVCNCHLHMIPQTRFRCVLVASRYAGMLNRKRTWVPARMFPTDCCIATPLLLIYDSHEAAIHCDMTISCVLSQPSFPAPRGPGQPSDVPIYIPDFEVKVCSIDVIAKPHATYLSTHHCSSCSFLLFTKAQTHLSASWTLSKCRT